ncbi:hypothetical protein HPB50_006596 [Hyalomma asiaticum]|uniref:Uncharacterized protein n=1 Tax=Hyalomma asiaticum TaxID=266040 RepID=A0ACB7SNI9_HYAAI|nr:hypothetical protein HPB50_006596 [Hyalomma asiaticum]
MDWRGPCASSKESRLAGAAWCARATANRTLDAPRFPSRWRQRFSMVAPCWRALCSALYREPAKGSGFACLGYHRSSSDAQAETNTFAAVCVRAAGGAARVSAFICTCTIRYPKRRL